MRSQTTYQFPFARYPAVRLGLLFSTGICLQHYLALDSLVLMMLEIVFLAGFVSGEWLNRGKRQPVAYNLIILFYLLLVLFFGALWYSIHQPDQRPGYARFFEASTWDSFIFHGRIKKTGTTSGGSRRVDITVDSTRLDDRLVYRKNFLLRATFTPADSSDRNQTVLQPGDVITFKATIYPISEKRNPEDFDYASFLASQNIYVQAGIDSIYSIRAPRKTLSWNQFRRAVLSMINSNFDSRTSSLAKAILIGYKNDLERDDRLAFSRSGLSHIMAVSGLHVGFIIAPFWLLIPFLWTFRFGKQAGLLLLIILLLGYAGLTGFSASVTRASITGALITYGRLFHKVRDSVNLTAVAAIVILIADPNELFEVGFQLSFSAVFIILLSIPVMNNLLPDWIRFRWYGTPLKIILVSMVIQVGLYPILAYYFGEFSLAGPFANTLVVPLLGIVVPFSLLLLPAAEFSPGLAYMLNTPNRWFLGFLDSFTETLSGYSWSWISTSVDSPAVFLIWAAALFFLAATPVARLRWKWLIILLSLLVIDAGTRLYRHLQPKNLVVTFFDVGQGDAILVQTPGGKAFLIDTGRWSPSYNSGDHVIIPHLEKWHIRKLDAVFLTHPHADHIGGIPALVRKIPVDTIYNSGYFYHSGLYRSYRALAREKKIPVVSLSAGSSIDLDPSVKILVYGPQKEAFGEDPNEHSLVIEVIYGNTEFLFTGDAGTLQERRLMKNYGRLLDTDLLKVGHHGSRTGSSDTFLNEVTPETAVVSLAFRNRFGHPHPEVITRLNQEGADLHYTSLEGALIFSSDGNNIQHNRWK